VLAGNNQDPADVVPDFSRAIPFPQRISASAYVMGGLLRSKQNPVYPHKAIAARIQGTVMLLAEISKEGEVTNLHVVSGPGELAPAAIEAAQRWLYRPYLYLGRPVEVETQLQINFALRER
jgi:protein TonB